MEKKLYAERVRGEKREILKRVENIERYLKEGRREGYMQ